MNKDTTQPSEQCSINQFSSRMCERGTKCCETQHTKPSEHAMRAAFVHFTPIFAMFEERAEAEPSIKYVVDLAARIDQHAIAPAVADRDRRIKELEEKAKQFVDQLERVHRDPRYMAVWEHAQNSVSLGRYTGPTYVDELKALVSVLAKSERSAP